MQVALVNKGVQIDQLRVLSTTTTYPTAASGTCSQGSINGICIGQLWPLSFLPASDVQQYMMRCSVVPGSWSMQQLNCFACFASLDMGKQHPDPRTYGGVVLVAGVAWVAHTSLGRRLGLPRILVSHNAVS